VFLSLEQTGGIGRDTRLRSSCGQTASRLGETEPFQEQNPTICEAFSLRNVESAWIKDMNVMIANNAVTAYKVNMEIIFVLE
jgi:dodecin